MIAAPTQAHRFRGFRGIPAQPPAVINWVGVRPPTWPSVNANGKHTYGKPVALFDGKTMDGWGVQHKQNPINWAVADGVMSAAEKQGNSLVLKEMFKDFIIQAEYAIAKGSNGGIYCAAAMKCSCSRTLDSPSLFRAIYRSTGAPRLQ